MLLKQIFKSCGLLLLVLSSSGGRQDRTWLLKLEGRLSEEGREGLEWNQSPQTCSQEQHSVNVTRVRAVTSRGAMGCRKVQQLASLVPPQQSTSNISAGREVYVGQEEGSWGCSSAASLELDRALQSPDGSWSTDLGTLNKIFYFCSKRYHQ